MSKKVNQSQTEDVYVIMEPGFENICGFDPANVVKYRPYFNKESGGKFYKCYKLKGSIGTNKKYWNNVRRKEQRNNREARCMVASAKTGKLIRCPEENKCSKCAAFNSYEIIKEKNRPISLEYITENHLETTGGELAKTTAHTQLKDTLVTNLDDLLFKLLLDEILLELERANPLYVEIFNELYANDKISQTELGKKFGIPQRKISTMIQEIRKIVKKLMG